MHPDDRKMIHDIRKSLCEAFTSIINGTIEPCQANVLSLEQQRIIVEQFTNIFYYVDSLLGLQDLVLDVEMAKQILDLISDVVTQANRSDQPDDSEVQLKNLIQRS